MLKWFNAFAFCLIIPIALQAQKKSAALTPADYDEIQNLYARYTHAFDGGDGQALANVYTLDGSFSVAGKVVAEGREKLAAQPRKPSPDRPHTRHLNANIAIEASAEGARGQAYVFITTVEQGKPIVVSNGGVYDDVIVKTADGWRFKRRSFTPWTPLQAATPARSTP